MKSLCFLLLACALPCAAEKVSTLPPPTAYVDDYANVLTPAGKAQIEVQCREVHDKTKAQIFFVTIKSLEGESIEAFSNDLFHKWKIGEKKTDRGVLLLLSIEDHKRRIEVGYGLEGILNDAKVGRFGREMVPALQAANYDEAARIGVNDIVQVIAADSNVVIDRPETGVSSDVAPTTDGSVSPPASSSAIETHHHRWVLIPVIVLFCGPFVGIFLLILWSRRRRRMYPGICGTGGGSYSGSSDPSSSFSSSSSDDSFSGGDGGDSGGGGASGDW